MTIAKTLTADAAYVLSAGKFVKAKEGTLAAGKAYLPIAAGSAPELQLSFGSEATGIKAIANSVAVNSSIFNLSGQRVSQPTKGLYIVNGKKVVMK